MKLSNLASLAALLLVLFTVSCSTSNRISQQLDSNGSSSDLGNVVESRGELFGQLRGSVGELNVLNQSIDQNGSEITDRVVEIEDPLQGTLRTRTDPQGNFAFPRLSAGERELRFPELEVSFPVTVFGGAEVVLQRFPVGRQEAISAVLQRLQGRSEFSLDESFIIAPHNPLPAGLIDPGTRIRRPGNSRTA